MKKKKLTTKKLIRLLPLALILLVFGTIGVKLLMQSHAATPTTVTNTGVTPIYRLFRYAGGHFFTASKQERDYIRTYNPGYRYEGVGFYAYTQQVAGSSPVYRLFDLLKGYHFYTINYNEYQSVAALRQYYRDEGVAYYAKASSGTGLTPVYRLYDYRQGIHFYTISLPEKNYLATSVSNIYRYEGIAYYLPDAVGVPGSNALYFSPTLGSYPTGSTFTATLKVNAAQATNAVQATINYDSTKLQFISIQNSAAFPVDAATATPAGQIRVGRGTAAGTSVTGENTVVTITFKMLSSTNQATLTFNPSLSLIAKASDSSDMLSVAADADYWVE